MLRSLYSGVSGMKVNQVKMDVIGNNIANVGTTAFKAGRTRFQDMLSQSNKVAMAPMVNLGGINPSQVGLGVQLAGIDTMVSQGMMQPTGRTLDLAVDGDGYFLVGKGPEIYATQSGGSPVDGQPAAILTDNSPAEGTAATHKITSNTSMNVMYTRDGSFTLDSDGNLLTTDGYRVMGYSLAAVGADGTVGTLQSIDLGTNAAGTAAKVINYVDASGGLKADDNELKSLVIPEFVLYTPDGGTATQVRIKTYSISKDGLITGVLEDGRVTALGQVAMATFKNPSGLSKLGKNMYDQSTNSGVSTLRAGIGATTANDNSKGYGDAIQGMLEMSNVDLAEQFTDMIVTSRAFQASGKMITTGDEMLQDIINLKR